MPYTKEIINYEFPPEYLRKLRLTEKKCSLAKIIETNFPGTKKLQEQDRRQIQILIKSSLHLMLYLYLSHLIWFLGILGVLHQGVSSPIKNFILTFQTFPPSYFLSPILHSKFTQGTLFSLDQCWMETV